MTLCTAERVRVDDMQIVRDKLIHTCI